MGDNFSPHGCRNNPTAPDDPVRCGTCGRWTALDFPAPPIVGDPRDNWGRCSRWASYTWHRECCHRWRSPEEIAEAIP